MSSHFSQSATCGQHFACFWPLWLFVLLIACVNVANLLIGRLSTRTREIAYGCIRYFVYASPIELPVGSDVSVTLSVLAFTAALTVATTLVFGIAPAWTSSQVDAQNSLRAAGKGSIQTGNRRLTSTLIALEIALPGVDCRASLLMRSVLKMSGAPLGFDPNNVIAANATLSAKRCCSAVEKIRFYDRLHALLSAIPGVQSTAIATTLPPYSGGNYEMQVEGRARTRVQYVQQDLVSDDYFAVLKIALHSGACFRAEMAMRRWAW